MEKGHATHPLTSTPLRSSPASFGDEVEVEVAIFKDLDFSSRVMISGCEVTTAIRGGGKYDSFFLIRRFQQARCDIKEVVTCGCPRVAGKVEMHEEARGKMRQLGVVEMGGKWMVCASGLLGKI